MKCVYVEKGLGFTGESQGVREMFTSTQTHCTHTNTLLDHKEKVVGYKICRDSAARHQREPHSSVLVHISQVQRAVTGESHQPLASTEQTGYLIRRVSSRYSRGIMHWSALETPQKQLSPQAPQRDLCPDAACKPLPSIPHILPSVFVFKSLFKLYILICD